MEALEIMTTQLEQSKSKVEKAIAYIKLHPEGVTAAQVSANADDIYFDVLQKQLKKKGVILFSKQAPPEGGKKGARKLYSVTPFV